MPELPEVETMCRCIAAVVGCRIDDVRQPRSRLQSISIAPALRQFRRHAVGKTISAVRRVGKRVVLELDDRKAQRPHPSPLPEGERTADSVVSEGEGTAKSVVSERESPEHDCIVIEPRMTGLVLLDDPPDARHLRLIVCLSGGTPKHVLFWDQRGLGVVRLLSHAQFLLHYGPDRLGPDALAISAHGLRDRLCASRRPVKVALLDQRALAGVGNLYASEILHLARIDPAAPCNALRPAQWRRLHVAMRKILRAAIRHEGSTLHDGTYRVARNKDGDYQSYHRVYQRAGQPCTQCTGTQIVRIVQAQRSTFYCPKCQRS